MRRVLIETGVLRVLCYKRRPYFPVALARPAFILSRSALNLSPADCHALGAFAPPTTGAALPALAAAASPVDNNRKAMSMQPAKREVCVVLRVKWKALPDGGRGARAGIGGASAVPRRRHARQ